MKLKLLLFFLVSFILQSTFSQNQANNWFFGRNAGLNFSNGNPTPIIGGALSTVEGCSSFSDEDGNLLFYTDGITVYDKNHQIMPNGNNLGGNPSSSQSGLIVPNPNNNTIFFLFTVGTNAVGNTGFPQNAGFKYYIIDITANNGNGDVISGPVDLSGSLSNQWTEKVTAVQTNGCNEYWVISLVNNTFYSFKVDAVGVSTVPVISTVSNFTNDPRGYLKVAPNGTKIVAANMSSGTYIYDFDNSTGIISSGNLLNINGDEGYGVEFSLDSKKLYISTGSFLSGSIESLYQFNLDLPDFNAINNSRSLIHTYANTRGALQLAVNGKIYWASDGEFDGNTFISVINNPENIGNAVNYEHRTISLGGQLCSQGLPPFIQSLFIPSLDIVIASDGTVLPTNLDLCIGDTFTLEPDIATFPATTTYEWSQTINGVTTVLANQTSSLLIDYNSSLAGGEYSLVVDFNDGNCILLGEATIIYHPNPVINSPVIIKQCDDDFDGISSLDLTILYNEITLNATNETITFYENQAQAIANLSTNSIQNVTNYTTNSRTIWVNVENQFGCTSIGQIDIQITATNVNFNQSFYLCDDFLDTNGNNNANNDDRDGISSFNFDVTNHIIALFSPALQANLSVAYYHNTQDGLLQQNEITNITNYRNINSPDFEKIYIRVNSTLNLDCIGFGENLFVELFVEVLPTANLVSIQRQCDDDQDGIFGFNTTAIANNALQGQTNVSLTYFNEDGSQITNGIGNNLPNPFLTSSQIITIVATNDITNVLSGPCSDQTTLEFIVDKLPFVDTTPVIEPLCDDNLDDNIQSAAFDTSLIEYYILGGNNSQLAMDVSYFNQDGSQIFNENGQSSPLPDPFITETQTITVQVVNPLNLTCPVSTTLDFIVNAIPEFDVNNAILCLNYLPTPLTINIINVPNAETYTYTWFDRDGNDVTVNSNNPFLDVSVAGDYSVIATTTDGNFCTTTKSFTIIESNIVTIENVTIIDNLPNNQISILISGEGEYEFAIDQDEFVVGNTPNGHIFTNVNEGLRIIKIRDILGCGEISIEVPVIRFPKFFTPNGDGIYDDWKVKGVEAYPISEFTIFDRHGKIITQFTGNDTGWNGTYLGKIAAQTDYWFLAIFIDQKGKKIERKGHFSLRL